MYIITDETLINHLFNFEWYIAIVWETAMYTVIAQCCNC